jgi:hypothetical protein
LLRAGGEEAELLVGFGDWNEDEEEGATRRIGTWQRARSKSAASVGAVRFVANIASVEYAFDFHFRT